MNGVLASMVAVSVCGQAAGMSEEAAAREAALERFRSQAAAYEMLLGADPPVRLELASKPVLNWANPERNNEDGSVFQWTKDGRPEVIGSIWTYKNPRTGQLVLKHAFHSLADRPISARFEERLVWAPGRPGVEFQPVVKVEPPASSSGRRLVQMRSMAREFTCDFEALRGEKGTLRLLTQPLVRYEPPKGSVKDGAIFAFVAGTDPDALLILEARQTADRLEWQFAFARFHFAKLTAKHREKTVWEVEADPDMIHTIFAANDPQHTKIYYSVAKPE